MVGKTISHYRIVSQLGAGGMGVVYAGEDPRLNRQVALKFVPEEMAHDQHTIERLRSEARTASSLNHPNICTIYDVGEYEGRPFIVMELLKGQTLRERMAVRPLKIHEAVDVGIQVAEALHAAHSRDVIHRDIKPANIFLVDQGQVKVLDFGLAKFLTPQPGAESTLAPTVDLTAIGIALGTVAYMSPEQASGEPLDRRTDLFSLGVVLYECVTGQQPFQGKTSAVVLAAILTQQPVPPMTLNPSIPRVLQDAIQNCLEKDRELRFQDAAGLRADLKRVKRDLESGSLGVSRSTAIVTTAAANPGGGSAPATGTAQAPAPSSGGVGTAPAAVPARSGGRGLAIGLGIAALAVAGVSVFLVTRGDDAGEPSPVAQSAVSTPPSSVSPPAVVPPPPSDPDATRREEEARASAARFDAAIVEANRLLAAGNADGATRALNVARAIDPSSPAVADLSARLVEYFRTESARRAPTDAARTQPGRRGGEATAPARGAEPPPVASSTTSTPVEAAPAPTPPAVVRPPVDEPPPAPVQAPPPRVEPERRPAPPPPAQSTAPVEDDDAVIRRVVATYARAIETKDLALYRSVKPNLSAAEQRTIEDGFRAVTSQRVTVNIQSIEHRGQDAFVRLRRHDVIQAGGRQQTADSQQTMTLTRGPSGWVIREIGR